MAEKRSKPSLRDERSKRQRLRDSVPNPGMNNKPQGEVLVSRGDGAVQWWDENAEGGEGGWAEAVYHNDIRRELLAVASNGGQNVYDHPRTRGTALHDETAFLERQRHWHGDSKECLSSIADGILHQFERNGRQNQDYPLPCMMYHGKIVLDLDSHPVRAFEDLPLTLSSSVEGWLLEAFTRVDGRINKTDMRARMPSTFQNPNKRGRIEAIFGLSAIGNRAMRFREPYGMVPWTSRAGSDLWRDFIWNQMTEVDKANNTTRHLPIFTKEEIASAKADNKGKFFFKTGKPRSSDVSGQDNVDDGANAHVDFVEPEHGDQVENDAGSELDFRYVKPTNEEEEQVVQSALQRTVEEFTQVFDVEDSSLLSTTQSNSYAQQYAELQALYEENLPDEATQQHVGLPAYLTHLSEWHGDFSTWRWFPFTNNAWLIDRESRDA